MTAPQAPDYGSAPRITVRRHNALGLPLLAGLAFWVVVLLLVIL